MIEGLLSILRNVLINISNCVPDNIIDKMFDAEKLVVLLNNPSPSVKIIILKVSLKLVLFYYIHLKIKKFSCSR
jgi:hypothetical protein